MAFLKNKLKVLKKKRSVTPCAQYRDTAGHSSRLDVNNNDHKSKLHRRSTSSMSFNSLHSAEYLQKSTMNAGTSPMCCNWCSETDVNKLCQSFDAVFLAEEPPKRLAKALSRIPNHDRKILERMAAKRAQTIEAMDNAIVAKAYWEQEEHQRKYLMSLQSEEYWQSVERKRKEERSRRHYLARKNERKHNNYLEKIRKEIADKDMRHYHRLKNIELHKELMQCEKRQEELQKFSAAAKSQHDNEVGAELRRQECQSRLEDRISRADYQRRSLLRKYQKRLREENVVAQNVHASKSRELQKIELYKIEKLKELIDKRNRKSDCFLEQKKHREMESRDVARTTSELREFVRTSFSPDNYYFIRSHRSYDFSPKFK